MSPEEIKSRFPNASRAFIQANLSDIAAKISANLSLGDPRPVAVVESNPGNGSVEPEAVQGYDRRRFLVRVTSVRKRLCDESNLCEKYHEDLCRYVGCLPSDAPDICHTEVFQRKALKGEMETVDIKIYELET